MTRNGYIKMHRSILDWEWYGEPNTYRTFTHLLYNANFQKTKYKGVDIDVGQCVFSLGNLSKELGLSIQNIRTALNNLKSTHDITWVRQPFGLIISIENWDKYQSGQHDTSHKSNTQLTQHQHAPQKIRNKEDKKYKNKEYNITPKTDVSALLLDFSDDVEIQNFLFKWLDVRKKKRLPMDEEVIRLNLNQINSMAEKSGLSVTEYLSEIIRRSWATFYEIPQKPEPKKAKQESKTEASYDLDKFREQSLHGELKYERKKKT